MQCLQCHTTRPAVSVSCKLQLPIPAERHLTHAVAQCREQRRRKRICRRQAGRVQACSPVATQSSSREDAVPSAKLGLLLECDGVLVDVHSDAHRPAFNKAFAEMGLDCTNWSPSLYYDLLRSGDGTAEGIISAYYNTVGWPMMIPTAERRQFLAKVHQLKRAALERMVSAGEIRLRQGAQQLIDDALTDGAKVALVAGTASAPEERIVDAALQALGPFRAQQIRVYTARQPMDPDSEEGSSAGSSVDEGPGMSLEGQLAAAQARLKQSGAQDFIESLKGSALESSVEVGIDPGLLVASQRAGLLGTSWLAACVATLDVPLRRCAFVAANGLTMKAAQGAGMLSAAVPPAKSARGVFPHADVSFDGFGPGGGATWPRLKQFLQRRADN